MGYVVYYTAGHQLGRPFCLRCLDKRQALDNACFLERRGDTVNSITGDDGEEITLAQLREYRRKGRLPVRNDRRPAPRSSWLRRLIFGPGRTQ
jgi:hypothetical protein